ncbi:MAG: hypothetical protein GX913_00640 [Clostridiales bacterium]|nr:hypothetical protein [Clostridiales bacterium]
MKKITKFVLGIILLFLIPFSPVYGSEFNGYVELNVELGFDGYMKTGRHMNAIAEVTTTEGFFGSVSVVVPTSEGENYLYEYPISLQDGETGVVQMNFPLFSRNDIIYFKVEDNAGKILAETDKEILRSTEGAEVYIGVLSENREISELLEDVNLGEYVISSYPYVGTRVMQLDPIDIGDTIYGLDGLDVLILDESKMNTLSTKQYSAVEEWNNHGGILFLETENDILHISSGADSSQIWMQPLDDRELLELMIETAFTSEAINKIIRRDLYYDGYEEYYMISNMLNTSIGTELPNLFWYILVIGLYILLVGPLLFFFLRKIKATSWTTFILICLSILFSFIIYLMGSNTRITEPFIQYATILNIGKRNAYEETFFNIRAPYNNSYIASLPSTYSLYPVPLRDYYNNTYEELDESIESFKDYKTKLSFDSDSTEMIIREKAPFSPEFFKADKEIRLEEVKELVVEATYYNDMLTGTVTNQTGMDLGYVTLILSGKAALIGDLDKGESINIEDYNIITYSPYYYYETARRITGLDEEEINSKEGFEYAQLLSKTNVIEYFLSQYYTKFSNQSSIIGFIKSDDYNKFHVNEVYPTYGVTLIQSDVTINNTVNGLEYEVLTSDSISNVDKEYNYDGISNTTYSGNIRLQYNLGNKETLEELHFVQELTEEDYTYYQPFIGKMYFYNSNTLEYDLVSIDKKAFEKEELLEYLYEEDGNYSILVQYIAENMSGEKYTEIQLPSVRLIRRGN